MSDFVKTWQLGFCLALGTAWLQASAVSNIVVGLRSWSAQLDNPGTALTVGGWIRLGAVFTRGLWLASTLFLLCLSQLNQDSAESDYHDNCRARGGGGHADSYRWYMYPVSWVGRVRVLVSRTYLAEDSFRYSLKPCLHKFSHILQGYVNSKSAYKKIQQRGLPDFISMLHFINYLWCL